MSYEDTHTEGDGHCEDRDRDWNFADTGKGTTEGTKI